jgi:hypothetical protein
MFSMDVAADVDSPFGFTVSTSKRMASLREARYINEYVNNTMGC